MTGNQHVSTKTDLLRALGVARRAIESCAFLRGRGLGGGGLYASSLDDARYMLRLYRVKYDAAPASTRRRWSCGK